MKAFCQKTGMGQYEAVDYLIDFYELNNIPQLIHLIQTKHRAAGFSIKDINQLSVLLTYLATILSPASY
jgi:hypothetical protein